MKKITAVILAAGKGTRMSEGLSVQGSEIPKVMFEMIGKPTVYYSIENLKKSGIKDIVLVVGYKKEVVADYFGANVGYAVQEEQLGTGHAVLMAEESSSKEADAVVVCYGDMPLFKAETIKKLIDLYKKEKPTIAMLTADLKNPFNYGRIIRDDQGNIIKNVEEKDCTEEEKKIHETNPCFYIFNNNWLWQNLKKLGTSNSQKEYYLTDLIKMANDQGGNVLGIKVSEESEAWGINTPEQLMEAEKVLKGRN